MAESTNPLAANPLAANPLAALSDHTAQLVERVAQSIVAVHGGGRASGIHWRSGVIVTAEENLERDEDIKVTLAGGREVAATLAGRDPSTDVAVLRFQPDGLLAAEVATAALRPGHLALAVGSHDGAAIASLGIVGYVGAAWQSWRGGTIDSLLRLDLSLSPFAEGGALVDVSGRVLGMTVFGPRRRVLAIPSSTIDRAVDQLLSKGHIARGYLGAGLQNVRLGRGSKDASDVKRGILVVSIDPEGAAARAGLVVGDIITAWNGKPVLQVREVMRLLGPDSVGTGVELQLLRAGAPANLKVTIGERPLT
jgi:S1-C subfamily serine protease